MTTFGGSSAAPEKGAKYLFESSWKRPYSDRGVRKILAQYSKAAGIKEIISPLKLRHFLFAWMKRQGIENPYIQPYSGHERSQYLDGSYKNRVGKLGLSA